MEVSFLSSTLSLFFLLTISVFTYLLSKKINFPYTVLLLIVWLLLVPLSQVSWLNFINHFELTPEILFYVFLPILLFESAYNINYRQLLKNWKSIGMLAVFWLIVAAFLVWGFLYLILPFFWFEIPFLVCLLFWAMIASTDPVAVLAIFKHVWAPRRLALLFEWESLFNDWTSLALFLVILGIILEWAVIDKWVYFEWIWTFLSMIIWWFAFWIFSWVLFSKIIWYIKNNEMVEITLTMVLAHITFLSAEVVSHNVTLFWFDLHISWIIATAIAWIIVWNYWRYKISPKVESHMTQFWEFFAFISNSLVFILMWLILSHVKINLSDFIIPITIVILVVVVVRFISVYLSIWIINFLKLEEKIPWSYTFLLSWWSLRWALALMMALMIPWVWHPDYEKIIAFQNRVWWNFDFDIKDFLIVIVIRSIMFTLFIKATTISFLLRKTWVSNLHELEEFEYYEWRILSYLKIIEKLNNLKEKNYLTKEEMDDLKVEYEGKLKEAIDSLSSMLEKIWKEKSISLIKKAISLHALWIEKQYLKNLFKYNEIWEKNFRIILSKINRQIERIEWGKPQLKIIADEKIKDDFFQKITKFFYRDSESYINKYIRNRAKVIITRKVIKELEQLSKIDFWFWKEAFLEVIDLYKNFNKIANEKKELIYSKYKTTITLIETKLANKSLLKLEENVIKDLYEKEIITPKLYIKFMEEIDREIYLDVKKI